MAHATGQRIRRARLAKGWTALRLAEALGVPERTPGRWEAGEMEPRGSLRRDLAEVLGLRYWELWPPEEVAADLSSRNARRALLAARGARGGGGGLYVHVRSPEDRAGAQWLARLWLVEDAGSDPGTGHRLFRLTGPGEEVHALLVAELQGLQCGH